MGLPMLAKSQLSYSIPESMLRLNKFEKIVQKMEKMKVKRKDFRLYQCSKKEKPLIHPKDCHKHEEALQDTFFREGVGVEGGAVFLGDLFPGGNFPGATFPGGISPSTNANIKKLHA